MSELKLMVDARIDAPDSRIDHSQKIMLTGSCFTEHIGNALCDLKFSVLQNPNGILFDPYSVAQSLISYTRKESIPAADLFYLNECWHSWQHHSRFSGTGRELVQQRIQNAAEEAHKFLSSCDWLVVTLGSSFSYRLVETGRGVANCHRAPAQWFRKHLMEIEEIKSELDNCIHRLFAFNPKLKIIFTVSPVRHIRDGVVENNRSKARLIEVVHSLVNKFDRLYYFPAYELVIDVLRDYRFYDIDLVHPNYQATQFVLDHFLRNYLTAESRALAEELQGITTAFRHKPFQPETEAHRDFLIGNYEKVKDLKRRHPYLDLEKESAYFGQAFPNE